MGYIHSISENPVFFISGNNITIRFESDMLQVIIRQRADRKLKSLKQMVLDWGSRKDSNSTTGMFSTLGVMPLGVFLQCLCYASCSTTPSTNPVQERCEPGEF